MEPGSDIESVVDKIRRGEISVLDAFAAELPDVFAAEVLPKLATLDTLRLAQVNKLCRDTVWSEDNVRSLGAKFQEYIPTIDSDTRSIFDIAFGHPIHWAAAHRVLPAVRALLKSEEEAYKTVNSSGLTALHYAVAGGSRKGPNLKIARMLIEAGADINKLTNDGLPYDGWTPMRFAASGGQPQAIKILIDAGADLNISSPLREAIEGAKSHGRPKYRRRCQACADLLIQAGANIPYVSDDDSEFDSEYDGSYCSEVDFD
mmetsp:Transcript_9420/g.42722  ORF Transcript_9420/g.42722 Transcript_9420/m.42722 type:complete len:260 (+) Transcript_9420:462-1241(+)